MSVDLNIDFTPETKRKIKALDKTVNGFINILQQSINNVMEYVLGQVKLNLTGRILNVGDGRLRNSMQIATEKKTNTEAIGRIGDLGSAVKYARIHDEGGIILPKNKPYLAFQINGRWIRTKRVIMPERMYLRLAVAENKSTILMVLQKSIINGLRAAV